MSFSYYILFPPKLREEIERLRLSNELDLEALNRMKKECPSLVLMLSGSLLIIPMFLYFDVSWPEIFVAQLIYLAILLLFVLEFSYDLWRLSYPFCFGLATQGVIFKCNTHERGFFVSSAYAWTVKYKYEVNGKVYYKTLHILPGGYYDKDVDYVGQKITVYYMEDNPKFSAPYITKLIDDFDFKRRRLNKGAAQ